MEPTMARVGYALLTLWTMLTIGTGRCAQFTIRREYDGRSIVSELALCCMLVCLFLLAATFLLHALRERNPSPPDDDGGQPLEYLAPTATPCVVVGTLTKQPRYSRVFSKKIAMIKQSITAIHSRQRRSGMERGVGSLGSILLEGLEKAQVCP
jgi:hypothetical protein